MQLGGFRYDRITATNWTQRASVRNIFGSSGSLSVLLCTRMAGEISLVDTFVGVVYTHGVGCGCESVCVCVCVFIRANQLGCCTILT